MSYRHVELFKKQKYSVLKKKAISSGNQFEDDEFPANSTSVHCQNAELSKDLAWKRPEELVKRPQLCIGDIPSGGNVIQGELGNCWLVAAVTCIALRKSMWSKVIVDANEQEWDNNTQHPGIFHFRFWRHGIWVDVVVDSLLPTRKGELIFMRSHSKNEFWSALLEKAYAKLFGCYESLNGGELAEALGDFTGGVSESCDIIVERQVNDPAKRAEFFESLLSSSRNNAIMCAAIPAKVQSDMEKANEVGLIKGHAYAITDLRKVPITETGSAKTVIPMIRIRNPWGQSEWTGAFSDRSDDWKKVDDAYRKQMRLVFANDGEFWMTFDDFCKFFTNMAICHLFNTSFVSVRQRWMETRFDGAWTLPMRAGGCTNNRATFFNNPQYMFEVIDDVEMVVFYLTQKTLRAKGTAKLTVGCTVFKVEDNRRYRIHSLQTLVGSSSFRNSQSVFWYRPFARGRYVLLACIFQPSIVGQFLIRVFSRQTIYFRELVLDKPKKPLCSACYRYPVCVTRLRVIRASLSEEADKKNSARRAVVNPYCVISCEGEKVRSDYFEKNISPEFDTGAVFYRKYPTKKPISIELYHHSNVGFEQYIGQAKYADSSDIGPIVVKLPITSSHRAVQQDVARLTVEVTTKHILDQI